MFLKQLYKHNKGLFILVLMFITGQLFINFKRGAVVTPFFHYGMYSEVLKPTEQYKVVEVFVNGKKLQGKDFSPWQWDKIIQPINYYAGISGSNQLFTVEVQKIVNRFFIHPAPSKFIQVCDTSTFLQWYQSYLATFVKQPIQQVQVLYRRYNYTDTTFQPTDSIYTLSTLCL